MALTVTLLICALLPRPEPKETVNLDFNRRDLWLSRFPRGVQKGFSIYGVRPGDNIKEIQAAIKAPLELRFKNDGFAEVYHPIHRTLLVISYESTTGQVQMVSIHSNLSFENDGQPLSFSENSLKSCELALCKWANPGSPNVGFDGKNELTAYPVGPGNRIGFISLAMKDDG